MAEAGREEEEEGGEGRGWEGRKYMCRSESARYPPCLWRGVMISSDQTRTPFVCSGGCGCGRSEVTKRDGNDDPGVVEEPKVTGRRGGRNDGGKDSVSVRGDRRKSSG